MDGALSTKNFTIVYHLQFVQAHLSDSVVGAS